MVKAPFNGKGEGHGRHRSRPTAQKRRAACRRLGGRSVPVRTRMLVSTKATTPKVSSAKKCAAREGGDRHPLHDNCWGRKSTLSKRILDGRTTLEWSGTTRSNRRTSTEHGSASGERVLITETEHCQVARHGKMLEQQVMMWENHPSRGPHGTTRRRRATGLKVAVGVTDDYVPAGPPRQRSGVACRVLN
jgi:hypothetical protein